MNTHKTLHITNYETGTTETVTLPSEQALDLFDTLAGRGLGALMREATDQEVAR